MPTTPINESQLMTGLWAELPVPTDATTSRTVVNNDAMRIVEFAMDSGQELTDHASDRAVAVLMQVGEMTFTVAGVPHDLVPGDVVYLAPGERHALVARSACRFTLVLTRVGATA
ncbi:MAG: cupin domain-containing protein [Candidatus Nanopelagicales bacterium]